MKYALRAIKTIDDRRGQAHRVMNIYDTGVIVIDRDWYLKEDIEPITRFLQMDTDCDDLELLRRCVKCDGPIMDSLVCELDTRQEGIEINYNLYTYEQIKLIVQGLDTTDYTGGTWFEPI